MVYKAFKKYLKEKHINIADLSYPLGLSRQSISYRLNGHIAFSLVEIKKLKEYLLLTPEQVDLFFLS